MPLHERVGRDDQLGGVREVRLANGVRCAWIESDGGIDVLVVLDRGMDIAACRFRGTNVVWHGPGGINPPHAGTMNDDEFQRDFFGGLLTTCGLEAFGPAGRDEYGSWGTHGHVNHIAAEGIRLRTDIHAEDAFADVSGIIRQARMFGESLRLERSWRMNRHGTLLRLHDRVTNEGGSAVPHMLLYHCNAGFPMLDEHLRVDISQRSMRPRDERARDGLNVWNMGGPPQADFAEQVFIHDPLATEDGWARAQFTNPRKELTWGVRFRPEQLPACFSWRMLGNRAYVMAVEPANCATIEGRIAARERGTLPMIEAGETREYQLEFYFRTTSSGVRA